MARPNSNNNNNGDIEFPSGIYAKKPSDKAPDFVWGKINIKLDDAILFLQKEMDNGEEWVNLELLESKENKLYLKIDRWKPDGSKSRSKPVDPRKHAADDGFNDDIPF